MTCSEIIILKQFEQYTIFVRISVFKYAIYDNVLELNDYKNT